MTSNPFLPRKPAFSSSKPDKPNFTSPPKDTERKLKTLLDGKSVLRMEGGGPSPAGFYRVSREDSDQDLFVKIVPEDHQQTQTEALKIIQKLHKENAPVIPPLDDGPEKFDEEHTLFVFPYIPYRFAKPQKKDLSDIGRALGQLHRAFHTIEADIPVKKRSKQRHEMMLGIRDRVIDSDISPGPEPGRLRSIFKMRNELLTQMNSFPDPQQIHGDLVYGNIIFSRREDKPFIIDFEDSTTTWLSPLYDVSMVLLRFILVESSNEEKLRSLSETFLDSYCSDFLMPQLNQPGDLYRCMCSLPLRSFCILSQLETTGSSLGEQEWKKMFSLYELIQASKDFLTALENKCLKP